MRVPTQAELDRWAAVASSSGNSAEGGRIVRLGAVDLITYSDDLHLRLLTPYPAIMDGREPESTDQPVMFDRTSDGAIVFQLGGLTDLIRKMSQDRTAPAEARQVAYELMVQITLGKEDTILLPAETDTIEVSLCDDGGREWLSEALPPDANRALLARRHLARWPPWPGPQGIFTVWPKLLVSFAAEWAA